jgi:hypothetical protein
MTVYKTNYTTALAVRGTGYLVGNSSHTINYTSHGTVCCIGTWKRKKVATSFRGSLDVMEAYEAYEMACIS